MRLNILAVIFLVAIMFVLSGCELYDYKKFEGGGEIPVTVAKEVEEGDITEESEDIDEFKKQLEKLQSIIEAEEEKEQEEEIKLPPMPVEEEEEEEELEVVTSGIPTITVKEGELVSLNLKSSDPDGDKVTYTFTKPLDENGKWKTGFNDAGTYRVTVTASDGKLETEQEVLIVVKETSRAPIISGVKDVTVEEGETVRLSPKVTDPDGGSVTLTYSGWMTKETKKVGYDESGMHTVTITAIDADGDTSKKVITVTVEDTNRPPEIILITSE